MRLLADENIPLDTVRALRSAGHDVYSATESGSGAPDLSHAERAIREDRVILTFDRDFGEMAVRGPKKPEAGVLLLRLTPNSAEQVTQLLVDLLARTDVTWRGFLSVVDEAHVRQRPI
jgi:predicted nuclease of predicted toxin-antitoxin system